MSFFLQFFLVDSEDSIQKDSIQNDARVVPGQFAGLALAA